MLDAATKRRIDTARDILVGKVPDPKSQVEQITIALIYKFMWDIDAESEELGGERSFFVGDFDRYGWPRLMHAGLGGHDTLYLYGEALDRIPENPGVPPLFRTIFNNAYLPYRDPETLRAFLKVIDEFEYDHSERLGDAFEYLLSVMGAQGDAGQFRTPRHITDFIVAVIDPKKHETVLDPACGTAGFLISSYKHILATNRDEHGQSTLTPDDRGRLADNVMGYDISPDMVRLSLVNLYLHGFADPHIHEYDTLTSDERWSQHADVILANPPFMSPKGGIRPHNRFSVPSKRSEVLFVDYMAGHLTPAGRAGIIVPEGIIFQSQRAHTRLREMLVEDSLVAVVSLPAGVFKPYSGVKTSILILDRALARRVDRIAFFKVENDGFDLGDQRRPIDKNDLPQVWAELNEYLRRARVGESLDGFQPSLGLVVEKERIAADGDYNLSGERYREARATHAAWPTVALGDVCEIFNGITSSKSEYQDFGLTKVVKVRDFDEKKVYFDNNSKGWIDKDINTHKYLKKGDTLMINAAHSATHVAAKIGFLDVDPPFKSLPSGEVTVFRATERIRPVFVNCLVRSPAIRQALKDKVKGIHIYPKDIQTIEIPLPPLEVQQEVVAEIEGYQKVIDGARAVIDNYRPHIPIDPDWPLVRLGEIASLEYGKPLKAENRVEGPYPVYGSNGIVGYHNHHLVRGPSIIVGRKGSAGAVNFSELSCYPIDTTFFVRIRELQKLDIRFCYYQLLTLELDRVNIQSGVPGLNRNDAYRKSIPLPSLATQQAIVAEIEAEQSLVQANRQLVDRFEGKIRAAIGRVWSDRVDASGEASNVGLSEGAQLG